MAIEVIRPGALTTVQDGGRPGHGAEGFSACGACDGLTYTVANALVGNAPGLPALECTFQGPALRFDQETVISVCGNMRPLLDGQEIPTETPVPVGAGSMLEVGEIRTVRAYIAFRGGLEIPPVLGSCSTDLKTRIGGYRGRALRAGDRIGVPVCDAERVAARLRKRAGRLPPPPRIPPAEERVLRVIPGPQEDVFTEEGIRTFYRETYRVSEDSNRMGMRLSGAKVASVRGTDILSDGILEGNIQIPSGGEPIVMLADHQTTGGYAKIATVIPTDLPLAAQSRPGDRIRFERISPAEAERLYREQRAMLKKLTEGMSIHEKGGPERGFGRKLRRLFPGHG